MNFLKYLILCFFFGVWDRLAIIYPPNNTWPMSAGDKGEDNLTYKSSTKTQDTLKACKNAQQSLSGWFPCYKHDPWKQTGAGREDVVGNMVSINVFNVKTTVVYPAASSLLICAVNKCVEWWGHEAWPLLWRKRAQPLDYFQTDRSEHRGKVYSWKEKTLTRKNRVHAHGNKNAFLSKKRWRHCYFPTLTSTWMEETPTSDWSGAVMLVGCSGMCATQTPVWSAPSGGVSVCLGDPLTCLQTKHLATLCQDVCVLHGSMLVALHPCLSTHPPLFIKAFNNSLHDSVYYTQTFPPLLPVMVYS